MIRLRAIDADEKLARREAILDAAERLYSRNKSLPSVAEVATEAGLAKGTMYLYFATKEAIYLALHERQAGLFFEALLTRLSSSEAFAFDAMWDLIDRHMIVNTNFLPLCNACMSATMHSQPDTSHEQFHLAMGTWLMRAGAGLEAKMTMLKPGDGVRLLHHGYALILGMYQLLGADTAQANNASTCHDLNAALGLGDFASESKSALSAYWQQVAQSGLPAVHSAK